MKHGREALLFCMTVDKVYFGPILLVLPQCAHDLYAVNICTLHNQRNLVSCKSANNVQPDYISFDSLLLPQILKHNYALFLPALFREPDLLLPARKFNAMLLGVQFKAVALPLSQLICIIAAIVTEQCSTSSITMPLAVEYKPQQYHQTSHLLLQKNRAMSKKLRHAIVL